MKNFIIKLGLSVMIPIIIISTFNYYIDPYQFYRKSDTPLYFSEQRYQNPGIARNYPAELAIIGTSMTENFLPSYVGDKFDKEAIRLSISGSSTYEQNLMVNVAMNHNTINTILWGIDYSSLRGGCTDVRDEKTPFPYYMYDNSYINDIKYLMRTETTKRSFLTISNKLFGITPFGSSSIEAINVWYNWAQFGKDYAYKDFYNREKYHLDPKDYEWRNIKNNIDNNIIKVINAHPDVNFILFYTPCSVLTQIYFNELGILDNEMKSKEYLYNSTKDFDNVSIYDFQIAEEIVTNLDYYKDMSHYNISVNEYIIDSILNNKYKLDDNNINKSKEKLVEIIESFHIEIY